MDPFDACDNVPPLPPGVHELSLIRLDGESLAVVLGRIADIAQRTIPNAREVSMTLVRDRTARTVAFSGRLALHLDERQYEAGGPCVDAATTGHTVVVDVTDPDSPYPHFTRACARAGITHTVSVALPVVSAGAGAALNVYAHSDDGLSQATTQTAQAFSRYAAVAVANAATHDQAVQLAVQLDAAITSRALIEQAKGILMAHHGFSADQAFHALVRGSQNTNKKLYDVAQTLVDQASHTTRAPSNRRDLNKDQHRRVEDC